MDDTVRDKILKTLGEDTGTVVLRFLTPDGSLCHLVEVADQADMDWPAWGQAAAVLQLWLEKNGRTASVARKLGYLSCTAEAQKNLPLTLRQDFAHAVQQMLDQFGFAE
jgi:hypothetical protein